MGTGKLIARFMGVIGRNHQDLGLTRRASKLEVE